MMEDEATRATSVLKAFLSTVNKTDLSRSWWPRQAVSLVFSRPSTESDTSVSACTAHKNSMRSNLNLKGGYRLIRLYTWQEDISKEQEPISSRGGPLWLHGRCYGIPAPCRQICGTRNAWPIQDVRRERGAVSQRSFLPLFTTPS